MNHQEEIKKFLLAITFGKQSFVREEDYASLEKIVNASVRNGYLDTCRVIHHIGDCKELVETAKKNLAVKLIDFAEKGCDSQGVFDKWHRDSCEELKRDMSNDNINFTCGMAQKWINMSFKYLYVANYLSELGLEDNLFQYCHVPIDDSILTWSKKNLVKLPESIKKLTAWSKLDNYVDYTKLQENFRSNDKFNDGDAPFFTEFTIWRKIRQKTHSNG